MVSKDRADVTYWASVKTKRMDRHTMETNKQLVIVGDGETASLAYEYFSVDRIIGYFIKLSILDRWLNLDGKKGQQVFTNITDHLASKVSLDQPTEGA